MKLISTQAALGNLRAAASPFECAANETKEAFSGQTGTMASPRSADLYKTEANTDRQKGGNLPLPMRAWMAKERPHKSLDPLSECFNQAAAPSIEFRKAKDYLHERYNSLNKIH